MVEKIEKIGKQKIGWKKSSLFATFVTIERVKQKGLIKWGLLSG